jgi:hypothetical protein
MKTNEFRKLIREEIKKVLNENYRDPGENLDYLIKLLQRKQVKQALELLNSVKEMLESNDLETAFDEAVENALDNE